MTYKLPRGRVWCRTCGGSGEIWAGGPSSDPTMATSQECWRCHGECTVTKTKAAAFGWPIEEQQGVTA